MHSVTLSIFLYLHLKKRKAILFFFSFHSFCHVTPRSLISCYNIFFVVGVPEQYSVVVFPWFILYTYRVAVLVTFRNNISCFCVMLMTADQYIIDTRPFDIHVCSNVTLTALSVVFPAGNWSSWPSMSCYLFTSCQLLLRACCIDSFSRVHCKHTQYHVAKLCYLLVSFISWPTHKTLLFPPSLRLVFL